MRSRVTTRSAPGCSWTTRSGRSRSATPGRSDAAAAGRLRGAGGILDRPQIRFAKGGVAKAAPSVFLRPTRGRRAGHEPRGAEMGKIPKFFEEFRAAYPDVAANYNALSEAVKQAGPLDGRTIELVK